MHTVQWVGGARHFAGSSSLDRALVWARELVETTQGGSLRPAVAIWDTDTGVIVAVITDDSAGVRIHRLSA